ncbi:MAG: HigA family addiction module antidote protein [Rubrobacter sp.]|nr:HigA family addiction module antidote protein [Rubrobacter sp.]
MSVSIEERVYPPMTPGRFLELEFLEPLGTTSYALAKAIGVDPPRMYKIVAGERAITADTALRLARYFSTSPQYWLNLQTHYDLEVEEDRIGESIKKEVQPLAR